MRLTPTRTTTYYTFGGKFCGVRGVVTVHLGRFELMYASFERYTPAGWQHIPESAVGGHKNKTEALRSIESRWSQYAKI